MTYEVFLSKVVGFSHAENVLFTVSEDRDEGKLVAVFSNGVRFVANHISKAITVLWASGHQSVYRV